MYFAGLGRNAVHKSAKRLRKKLSASSVSRTMDEFSNLVNEIGIEKATVKYRVNEQVKELLEIAQIKKDNDVSASEMVSGARISKSLENLGVGTQELDKFEVFVTSVYRKVEKEGLTLPTLLSQIQHLQALETKYKIDFETLKSEYDSLSKSVPELRQRQKELEGKIVAKTDEYDKLVGDHKTTVKRLERDEKLERDLAGYGLNLSKVEEGTRNFLALVETDRKNAARLVGRMKNVVSLDDELSGLQSSIKTSKDQEHALKQEINKLTNQAHSLKDQLAEAKNLADIEISVSQVQKLRNLLVDISSKRGMSAQQAMISFQKDILDNYDLLLGLRPEIDRLTKEKNKLVREKKSILEDQETKKLATQRSLERIQGEYGAKKKQVEDYSMLRSKDITDEVLLAWGRVIKDSNLTLKVVEAELRSVGSLANVEKEAQHKIDDLTKRVNLLNSDINDLESKKSALESTISQSNSHLVELTNNTTQKIKSLLNEATPAIEKLTKSIENSREVYLEIGKMEAILPLWKLLYGEPKKIEVDGIMRVLLVKYQEWVEKNESGNVHDLNNAITTILSHLSGSPSVAVSN